MRVHLVEEAAAVQEILEKMAYFCCLSELWALLSFRLALKSTIKLIIEKFSEIGFPVRFPMSLLYQSKLQRSQAQSFLKMEFMAMSEEPPWGC